MGTTYAGRVAAADWEAVKTGLDDVGCALLPPPLLTPAECRRIIALWDQPDRFRATINLRRHRFGDHGDYKYFTEPFPEPVQALREALYPRLLPIARDWSEKLRWAAEWPETLEEWLEVCHRAGQAKPTPILLRYEAGGWNALHRDLYGDKVFPLQVVVNLNEPGTDHTGGEFLLTEQRPRAQSRGTATLIPQGHGLVFTTREKPVPSVRGWSKGPVRHGVSLVRSGIRHTLGLVFHDAG
ncbi:2OG-Fe(II) oxygenase [Amycolatopsis sp. PS_44_ISF1]|uniref:2OG-Fe(II) oxygenase n=1 Tax=Amycolatopsis sp. PS_44_ISF1 TaxID=2974917 RepID=UPI0028DEBD7C|nr:2OG-Fe(II) oxygenase [Amycolatopsis sp. PS_44_ISF1]MDT8911939.1 2OG-Fe(II) oxygenase [Amycolatopsis sp. PS_44_ISF1]